MTRAVTLPAAWTQVWNIAKKNYKKVINSTKDWKINKLQR